MKKIIAMLCGLILSLALSFALSAQSRSVTVLLQDSSSGEPLGYATVSLTKAGASSAFKYALTSDQGKAVLEKVAAGTYTFKAELLGYKTFTKEITVKDDLNLGTIKVDPDKQVLNAASVSATGNPIVIKKDTVEYNASSFKTTDNDVLEDLLKKLPGVEVSEDGSVTANGQTISKITIDGKTFFLLGDINKPAMNVILANNSSETLKGDIVQLAHHVYNSLQNLYHKIQASVVLAPQTEGGAVQSTTRKDIIDTAKQYVKNDMVYYGGSRTDGIAVVNGEITHVYTAPIDGGGYTGWSW